MPTALCKLSRIHATAVVATHVDAESQALLKKIEPDAK
jgi:hypothetical protein